MRPRAVLVAVAALGLAAAAPLAASGRGTGQAATSSTTLTASTAEVRAALVSALREWPLEKDDPERGLVRTAWVDRRAGDAVLRERLVGEYRADGYLTHVAVRDERQRRLDDLASPSLGGPSASWRAADGDHEVARAVVRSVEQALGEEPAGLPLESLRRPETGTGIVVERREHVVSPEAAVRINRLKDRRRDLVKEIRAIDARVAASLAGAAGADPPAQRPALVARKAAFEDQVTAIDREILALVLAE